jgi:hypothetical protein
LVAAAVKVPITVASPVWVGVAEPSGVGVTVHAEDGQGVMVAAGPVAVADGVGLMDGDGVIVGVEVDPPEVEVGVLVCGPTSIAPLLLVKVAPCTGRPFAFSTLIWTLFGMMSEWPNARAWNVITAPVPVFDGPCCPAPRSAIAPADTCPVELLIPNDGIMLTLEPVWAATQSVYKVPGTTVTTLTTCGLKLKPN